MRSLLLLVLGIAFGATVASLVLNALGRRDAHARGVMQVLQHEAGVLHSALRSKACGTADATRAKMLIGALTEEIEPSVLGDSTADPPFREYLQRLRDASAELAASAPDCAALAPIVTKIGDACDACHRQYR
jgi:cytochrome c556